MPQGPIPVNAVNTIPSGAKNKANISVATVVKAAPGSIIAVSVVTAGSTVGTINDCATTAAAASTNQVGVAPNAVGVTPFYSFPCTTGIVVVPGTGQVLAVGYV
jgi:hypothetical protein